MNIENPQIQKINIKIESFTKDASNASALQDEGKRTVLTPRGRK